MKRSVRQLVFALLCIVLFSGLAAGQQASLTILHTNDTHGHLLPFSYPSRVSPTSELAALKHRRNIGGIARRATLVKRLRADLERKGTTVWLVDAGDFCDGTPFSTKYGGEADVDAMNAAGYTFGTLGNHEFNNSFSKLQDIIARFKFPLLCANVIDKETGQLLVRASEVRQVGPLKVAIFGLTTREGANYAAAKDRLVIADEIDTSRRMTEELRRQADIVILLSHAGKRLDEQIGSVVPGIDVIIGGHSHSRLPIGEPIPYAQDLNPKEPRRRVLVQAFEWGGELGRLDLQLRKSQDGSWRVAEYQTKLMPVTSEYPEDKEVAAIVDRYWKPIASRYGVVVGKAADDFVQDDRDLANYNLVADAVREAYGTEIALENTGGVRAPLVKGNITLADMVELDPFTNTVVTFKITGKQLREVLLKNRPAVSGMRYRLDGGQLVEATVGGEPIDDNRIYTAATNSYFIGAALKGIASADTGRLRRDVVIDYIRKKGTVRPLYDGRRIITNPRARRF